LSYFIWEIKTFFYLDIPDSLLHDSEAESEIDEAEFAQGTVV
jgi:hypothetical protein